MSKKEIEFPYIVWSNYGYEGWSPTGYNTIDEAIRHDSYGSEKIITKLTTYKVIEEEVL